MRPSTSTRTSKRGRVPVPGARPSLLTRRRLDVISAQRAGLSPSPALVFDTLFAYQRTAALRAAIELDLFRAIGEGPGDVGLDRAALLGLGAGIRILCDFLTVIGLPEQDRGRYGNSETSAMFLDPRSPACVASTARFLGNPMVQEPFHRLAEIVRKGRTVLPGQGSVEPENPAWVEFAHSMAPMMAPMAGPLGSIVLDGKKGPVSVLDIAAGHGLFGIEVAKQNPEARSSPSTGPPCSRWRAPMPEGGGRRPLRDATRQRVRGRLRRAARHRAAHQLPAPLRSADLHRPAEEGARLAQARRSRRGAGVRAQRGSGVAADGRRPSA